LLCLMSLFIFISAKAYASVDSVYDFVWLDPDKKVYVLQNKLFEKEKSIYLDLGYFSSNTSKFQDTNGAQGRVGYYFHEEWAVELGFNYYSNKDNEDVKNVQIINQQKPFIRRFNSSYGLTAIWSPFYGKINTFNRIFYFDWSFGAGVAQINAEDNLKSSLASIDDPNTPDKFDKKSMTGAVLKTNMKFYINERIHVGLEFMNTYFKAPSPKSPKTDKLKTNTDAILFVGFSI
jgi:outer membrane beta-barrel protein